MCRRLLISASGLEHIHRFRAADSVRATTDRNGTVQIYCPHKIFLLFTKFFFPEMSGWNAHMSRRGPHRRQKYLFSPRASEQSTTTPPRPRPTNTPAPAAPLLIVWPPPSLHPSPAEAEATPPRREPPSPPARVIHRERKTIPETIKNEGKIRARPRPRHARYKSPKPAYLSNPSPRRSLSSRPLLLPGLAASPSSHPRPVLVLLAAAPHLLISHTR